MANLEAEYEEEINAQKCLQVELCLLREKLLYALNDTWSSLLKWTLPAETRRATSKSHTVRLEVRLGEEEVLRCTVHAMASVSILESRLRVFCERLMRHFVEPVVQDEGTLLQVVEDSQQLYMCALAQLSSPKTLADPIHVIQKLHQVFTFIHKPMANIFLEGDKNASKEYDLKEKIGAMICKRLFECIYSDCLCHAIPKTAGQFEGFGRVVSATEEFQALLIKLGFMLPHQATLMDYLNNVSRLFASVKSQEMVKKAHKLLAQKLGK